MKDIEYFQSDELLEELSKRFPCFIYGYRDLKDLELFHVDINGKLSDVCLVFRYLEKSLDSKINFEDDDFEGGVNEY